MKISVTLNKQIKILEANPEESLVKVLRKNSCISVRNGCMEGFCGSCTVLLNDCPVAIRVPSNFNSTGYEDLTDYSKLNKFKMAQKGSEIAIIGLGSFYQKAEELSAFIEKHLDINPTLINPCFITGLDEEMLNSLKSNHKLVITLEDGELDGGFGEKISRFYGNSDMKVLNYGSFKEFTDRVPLDTLYKKYRLLPELILEDIKNAI